MIDSRSCHFTYQDMYKDNTPTYYNKMLHIPICDANHTTSFYCHNKMRLDVNVMIVTILGFTTCT